MEDRVEKSLGTHDGHFHADEITACALLILFDLIDKNNIFRTRDEEVLKRCEYVCDVGGIYDASIKRFDHHQVDYTGDMSSAGMILLYLKDEGIVSDDLYKFLNNFFIKGVDAHDIGNVVLVPGFCNFSQVVDTFMPLGAHLGTVQQDKCFYEALDFTLSFLKRVVDRFYHLQEMKKIVKKAMDDSKNDKYIVFDKAVSWVDLFFELGGKEHPALFIIMPTQDQWKLRGVPPSYEDRMAVRRALPAEWAGLRGEALQKASGIEGAIFCHKGRFISFWKTKEDALQALNYVLEKEGKE